MSCVRLCFAGCVVQNSRRHGGRARTGCQKCVLHLLVNYGSQGKCLWVMLHKTNKLVIGNATESFGVVHCSKVSWLNVLCVSNRVCVGSHVGPCCGTSCNNLHWHVRPV